MLIGEWKQWYKNGNKYFSGIYKDSNQEGDWLYYSPNGLDSSKISYFEGKPQNGKKIEWYNNGKKESEITYVSGGIKGPVSYWYDNGNKKLVENYSNNQLNGSSIKWDKQGRKYLKQKYSNGDLREEKKYAYHELGQIESTIEFIYNTNDEITNEIVTKWSTSGKLLSKLNNGTIWKGEVTSWWDDESKKKKEVVTYLDGRKHGKVKMWYKNNKLKYKGNYKNGLMNGKWTYYWNNGNIKAEGIFISGNGGKKNTITKIPTIGRDGQWISWYKNGEKWSEIYFADGKKQGSQINWYDNGQKELQGYYEDDIPVKTWSWWYVDGSPMQEGKYNDQGKFEGLYFINPPVPEFTYP